MLLSNGKKVWVHGNATEHMAEYAQHKVATKKFTICNEEWYSI
jgi:hypothetical protein